MYTQVTIGATDGDGPSNADLTYQIIDNDARLYFKVCVTRVFVCVCVHAPVCVKQHYVIFELGKNKTQTDRQIDIQADFQIDRHANTPTHTHTHTDTYTHK